MNNDTMSIDQVFSLSLSFLPVIALPLTFIARAVSLREWRENKKKKTLSQTHNFPVHKCLRLSLQVSKHKYIGRNCWRKEVFEAEKKKKTFTYYTRLSLFIHMPLYVLSYFQSIRLLIKDTKITAKTIMLSTCWNCILYANHFI